MIDLSKVSLSQWLVGSLTAYLVVEATFYVIFCKYMVPKANLLVKPAPYRDYGKDRCKLLFRMLRRIEETCAITKSDVKTSTLKFLSEWFHIANKKNKSNEKFPGLSSSPSSSPENSDDDGEDDGSTIQDNDIILYKEDVDDLLAWAFFGKHLLTMLPWESLELDRIYALFEQRHDLTFPQKPLKGDLDHASHSQPRCMTLEPIQAIHRPLLVYMIVYGLKLCGGIFLYTRGFRRHVATNGLVAWHRPAKDSSKTSLLPMLFFHGIAPGGLMLYLPMVLNGLSTERDRPVFLFENKSISCALDFKALTEQETVDGVIQILEQADFLQSSLSLVGHSFGSCPITWLLASKRLPNIQQVVLLDPVAILLSEPDVMVNFLYAQEMDKIRMVASSELFTEYYLRRHFAWYNSELWLEDVNCSLLVCLSEQDEIINARKVKQEIERHASPDQVLYWKNVGHADCVTCPSKWRKIKQVMLEQELKIEQAR